MRSLLLGLVLLSVGVGCVQRTITVTSQPTGALVYLNDEEVGRTPVSVPFTHYGTYDVRLEADGYEPLWTEAQAKAPWWEYPGPDLVAEAVPGGESEIAWHFQMQPRTPAEEVDVDKLRSHATQMRAMTREGGESDQ
jgi:hypothetical protein